MIVNNRQMHKTTIQESKLNHRHNHLQMNQPLRYLNMQNLNTGHKHAYIG